MGKLKKNNELLTYPLVSAKRVSQISLTKAMLATCRRELEPVGASIRVLTLSSPRAGLFHLLWIPCQQVTPGKDRAFPLTTGPLLLVLLSLGNSHWPPYTSQTLSQSCDSPKRRKRNSRATPTSGTPRGGGTPWVQRSFKHAVGTSGEEGAQKHTKTPVGTKPKDRTKRGNVNFQLRFLIAQTSRTLQLSAVTIQRKRLSSSLWSPKAWLFLVQSPF